MSSWQEQRKQRLINDITKLIEDYENAIKEDCRGLETKKIIKLFPFLKQIGLSELIMSEISEILWDNTNV